MSLRRVAEALQRLGSASLSQLSGELGAPRDTVEEMLEFWIRRGDVTRCTGSRAGCGTTCTRCPIGAAGARQTQAAGTAIVYEWVA